MDADAGHHRLDRQLRARRHHHDDLGLRTARAGPRLREPHARSRDLARSGHRRDHRPRALERRQGPRRHGDPGARHDGAAFRPARRGEIDLREIHLLSARDRQGRGAALPALVPRARHPHQDPHRRRVALRASADLRLRRALMAATGHRRARQRRADPDERRRHGQVIDNTRSRSKSARPATTARPCARCDRMRAKGSFAADARHGHTGRHRRDSARHAAQICYIASVCGLVPAEAIAVATGNTAARTVSTSACWRPAGRRT